MGRSKQRAIRGRERPANVVEHMRADWIFHAAQGVLFLKVTLLVVLFDPNAVDSFALPKSTASHAATYVLVALLSWLALRYGRSLVVSSPIHLAVAALTLAFALATPFALDQTVALYGTSRRYLGLTHMLDSAVLYFATVVLLPTRRDVGRFATVAGAGAIIVLLYAFAQRNGWDPVPYVVSVAELPISTLGQPDTLSGYLSVVAASGLAMLAGSWGWLTRIGRVASLAISAAALFLLFSMAVRSGLLGLVGAWAAGLAAVVAAGGARRSAKALALGLVPGALALVLLVSPMGARFTPQALTSGSAEQRVELWETAFRLVVARPLLGVGPDNFAVGYPSMRAERSVLLLGSDVLQSSTHDWLLYAATSAGLVGAAALVAMAVLVVREGLRLARRGDPAALALIPAGAYLGQGLVNITDLGLDWTWWVCAGILASGAGTRGRTASERALRRRRLLSAVAGSALLLAAFWGVWASRARVGATEAAGQSRALVNAGRGLEAVNYALRALTLDGRRGEYWSAFGTALSAAGNPSAAASAYEAAAEREPWQPLYWRNLALTRLAAGDGGGAFSAVERATRADQYDAQARDLLARLALGAGDYARAAAEGERTVRLVPSNAAAYEAPAQAYLRLGRWEAAEALLSRALKNVDTAHLRVLLARALAGGGRTAEALQQVERALVIDPGSHEALELDGRLRSH